jgi:hypothetical protein
MRKHKLNLKDFDLDEIESIDLIGEEDTIDITVEDTHMFYANEIYTHNSSISAQDVDSSMLGGSIKKGQIAHFLLSIAKTLEQKETGRANMAILKSRFGIDGVIFSDILFDNARIQIDVDPSSAKSVSESKENKKINGANRVTEVFNNLKNKTKTN